MEALDSRALAVPADVSDPKAVEAATRRVKEEFGPIDVRGSTRRSPIYQPEFAAEAILWAARHGRREVYAGASTVITILGNKLAPWIADH